MVSWVDCYPLYEGVWSGTTGKPKGVMMRHKTVVAVMASVVPIGTHVSCRIYGIRFVIFTVGTSTQLHTFGISPSGAHFRDGGPDRCDVDGGPYWVSRQGPAGCGESLPGLDTLIPRP